MKLKLRFPKVLLVAVVLLSLVADSVSAGSRIRRKPMRRCCPQPVANVPGCCPQRCVLDDKSLLRKICLQELIAAIGNGNCIWIGKVCLSNPITISVMADCNSAPGQVCNDCSVKGRLVPVEALDRVPIEPRTQVPFYANHAVREPTWVTKRQADDAMGENGWNLSGPTYVKVNHESINVVFYFALYHAEKSNVESRDFGVRVNPLGLNDAIPLTVNDVTALSEPEFGGVREVVINYNSMLYHVHLASDDKPETNDTVWPEEIP